MKLHSLPLGFFRLSTLLVALLLAFSVRAEERPNVVLVMSDDQGWGQTGYNGHPLLKTPNLDAMAEAGIRFNRFYAGASNCSPTRASVLTGRSNDRTGVQTHGYPLRRQEKTIAQALKAAGYATGHFGKWHLNALRGPGAPVLENDPLHPGVFGFDTWVSVSNFFDLHPVMSRGGEFEEFSGDSSEIAVAEALKFIKKNQDGPVFAVVWFGTPHSPFMANAGDMAGFEHLEESERNQLGELVAMDRALGTMRAGLRELGIEDKTVLWFNSDNGGLSDWGAKTVGGLRGFKNQVYEGGIRVPAVVEWPGRIAPGQQSDVPAVTMDIFPTIGEILGLPKSAYLDPIDGVSLVPAFNGNREPRAKPIPFRRIDGGAVIDNDWKIVGPDLEADKFELYNLADDPTETTDLYVERPKQAARMMTLWRAFDASRLSSIAGNDYVERMVGPDPVGRENGVFWWELPEYETYLAAWSKRPEFEDYLKRYFKSLEK